MPPLAVHREVLEATGAVQRHMNEWEPRVAAGADLLPIPSALVLEKELEFAAEHPNGENSSTQTFRYKANTTLDDRLAQEYKFYIGHGGTAMSESVIYYDWDDTFGYSVPELQVRTDGMHRTGRTQLDRLARLDDGTILLNRGQLAVIMRASTSDNLPGRTIWTIAMWDSYGMSDVKEVVDELGRLASSDRFVTDEYGKRREGLQFTYDETGRLVEEVKAVTELDKDKYNPETGHYPKRTETTRFSYPDAKRIELETRLEDGTLVRASTRHYDDEGRLTKVVTEENLPCQHVVRQSTLNVTSYEPRFENLAAYGDF